MPGLVKLQAVFYRTEAGKEPVRAWLKTLSRRDRKLIGDDVQTVQYGWPIGMPLVKNLGGGIWEVRSDLTDGRIARILFITRKAVMVLLHGVIKKSQRTPAPDLALAKKRKSEVQRADKS